MTRFDCTPSNQALQAVSPNEGFSILKTRHSCYQSYNRFGNFRTVKARKSDAITHHQERTSPIPLQSHTAHNSTTTLQPEYSVQRSSSGFWMKVNPSLAHTAGPFIRLTGRRQRRTTRYTPHTPHSELKRSPYRITPNVIGAHACGYAQEEVAASLPSDQMTCY